MKKRPRSPKRQHIHTTGEHLITSTVEQKDGRWWGSWFVGTRHGKADFDTKPEADDYCKRNINREIGF
jgi:hypothetical protein